MSISIETTKAIVAEREAGYLVAEIAAKHGVSVSAVKSICKKNGAIKFASRNLLVENARQQIINDSQLAQRVAHETGKAILTELALSTQIKQAASLLIERIYDNDSNMTIAMRSRSLAAVSTSIVNAQSLAHKALNLQKEVSGADFDDLPSLIIEGYTDAEMQDIRKRASMSDLELSKLEESEGL